MSLADIDKMVAAIDNVEDEDLDEGDLEDDDLLQELQVTLLILTLYPLTRQHSIPNTRSYRTMSHPLLLLLLLLLSLPAAEVLLLEPARPLHHLH